MKSIFTNEKLYQEFNTSKEELLKNYIETRVVSVPNLKKFLEINFF